MARPDINQITTGDELKRWYWLKQELVDYCKTVKLPYTGTKFDILERIAARLDNATQAAAKPKPTSKFNWATAVLTPDTVITDSYTNGANTRAFFVQHCGQQFHFSIAFMAFMRNNCGKTLQDAIKEWHRLQAEKKQGRYKTTIPAGNQYNQYLRDFFADNPQATLAQARHCWMRKRSQPTGRHMYERADLDL